MNKAIIAYFLFIALLCILSFIYWPNLSGPFLLDDFSNIEPLKTQNYTPNAIWHSISKEGIGPHSRPISKLSLISTLALHGNSSWGFKYHNLITHLLIALLLFWLSGRLLQYIYSFNTAWFIAALATTLWVIAPIQVSTVLYPVQRMAQLAALFTVIGLLNLSFAWDALKNKHRYKAFFLGFIAFPICLFLGSFSKPNGLLLLLYVLVLGFILPINQSQKIVNSRFFRTFLFCILAPIVLGTFYLLSHWHQLIDYSMRDFTLSDRLLTQINVLIFYIKLICFPQLNNLTLFHDDFPITKALNISTIISALILFSMIIGAWVVRNRTPLVSFGIFWFFTGHLMESTIFQLEMVFEHRNYLASFGLMLIIASFISTLPIVNTIKYPMVIIWVLILLGMTSIRSNTWKNNELLYLVTIQDHPNSVRARGTYANILLGNNKVEEAREHLNKAITIQPREAGSLIHLYTTYCFEAMPNKLVAQAKNLLSNYPISAYGITSIYTLNQQKQLGKCPNLQNQTTLSLIDTAIKYKKSKINLEVLYRLKAQALIINNDFDAATIYFNKSYQIKKNTSPLLELLKFQISFGLFSKAHSTIERLRSIDKNLHKDQYQINYLENLLKKSESS